MVYQRNTQYSCLYCILDPCCLLHSKHHSLHLPTPNFRSIALPLAITSLFSCGLTMICESWTPCTLVLLAKCQDSKWLKQNPWLSFKYIDTVLKVVFPSFWLANSKPLLKYTCFFLQKYFLSLLYIVYAQNWNEEYETHTCTLICMCTCMCVHAHTLTLSVSHFIDRLPSIPNSKSKFGNTIQPINLEHSFFKSIKSATKLIQGWC